jgi:hypothetical protein
MNLKKTLLLLVVCVVLMLLTAIRSNPLAYTGYCQKVRMEAWTPRNIYPCSYRQYLFTSNSSDFSLYFNSPGG